MRAQEVLLRSPSATHHGPAGAGPRGFFHDPPRSLKTA